MEVGSNAVSVSGFYLPQQDLVYCTLQSFLVFDAILRYSLRALVDVPPDELSLDPYGLPGLRFLEIQPMGEAWND
jgi:hypothetical protein